MVFYSNFQIVMKPDEHRNTTERYQMKRNKWIYGSRLGNSLDQQNRMNYRNDELSMRMHDVPTILEIIVLGLVCLFLCELIWI